MKAVQLIFLLCFFLLGSNAFAQKKSEINLADSTGLPGDNFSLEGALASFKESKSLEDFEKRINSKDNAINNLDLNGDGKIDYVKVVADKKGDVHVVIMQIPVSKTEAQDVAVIEIEKKADKSAFLQILGDKDLYGEMKIVEPKDESEPADPGINRKGPSAYTHASFPIFVNVWYWPCIQFMYAPVYVVYVSPWYWDYYPVWWSPWHPYSWRYHYMHNYHHHHHYHSVYEHRSTYAHEVYAPRRRVSSQVTDRYREPIKKYRDAQASRPVKNGDANQARPVSKPAPGGVKSKSDSRPVDPAVRPSSKPATDPKVRPDRPQQISKPGSKPDNQPPPRHISKPESKPDKPQDRPQAKPGKKPEQQQARPQSKPQQKPQSKPQGPSKSSQKQSRPR